MSEINIHDIIHQQRVFFNSGKTLSARFRIDHLKKLKAAILTHENELITSIQQDFYRPEVEIYTSEIGFVLSEIDYTIRNLGTWMSSKKVSSNILNAPARAYWYNVPLGIVFIIGPWNYPVSLLITPLLQAISAGNCALLKPSECAPLTSRCIKKCIESCIEPECVHVLEGGPEIVRNTIATGVDMVFFTGGHAAGTAIAQAAAAKLTPVVLELGGKNPCIVERSCDLQKSAQRVIWGKFFNAGQTCVAPDYCCIDSTISNEFIQLLKMNITRFYGDNPEKSKDFARIVNRKNFDRLKKYLTQGTVIAGGITDEQTLYISPTLMENISFDMSIMHEEIFGPILPIFIYTSVTELLSFLNRDTNSLIVQCFSKNRQFKQHILYATNSGSVCFNGTLHRMMSLTLPFGGVGKSGFGRYHGKDGFETFSYKRSVLSKSSRYGFDMIYPPYKTPLSVIKKMWRWIF